MELDPLIKRLRGVAIGGLAGLQNGALPSDVQRSILDRVRASQASRGLEDSAGSIAAEAGALAGGAEQFRQSRINQALQVGQQYNTGGQMLSGGVPSFSQLLQAQQNSLGVRNQQAQAVADWRGSYYKDIGQGAVMLGAAPFTGGASLGLGGMGLFGGGAAAAAPGMGMASGAEMGAGAGFLGQTPYA